ncbi:MAG: pentapeptide repeat-containing protein [Chroococcales cyanobacterium]
MQVQEFLLQYQQGKRNFAYIDLNGANLSGANLRDINLNGANLNNVNLSWASLDNAQLTGASLRQANLHNATLTAANCDDISLSRAKLSKVDLRLASLRNADLNWANLQDANLTGVDLQGARLDQVNLERAQLNNANLREVELMEVNLSRASLIQADLTGANLREAFLEAASLREAILTGANLTEANLASVYLRSADLKNTDFHRAILTNADLSEANCDSADFSRANLTGAYLLKASFRKAYLLRTILQDVYLLHTDLSEANLRGADLRRADLSGAYLKEAILSEANLSNTLLLKSHLIRTNLDGAEMTGCCIHSWHVEEVDFSKVSCRYVFENFNYALQQPTNRRPGLLGKVSEGQGQNSSSTIKVEFESPPNWQALVFTLAQVELDCPSVNFQISNYQENGTEYQLQLSASRIVNVKLIRDRILQLYPEFYYRYNNQSQAIFDLLDIHKREDFQLELPTESEAPVLPSEVTPEDKRLRLYQQVVTQIQLMVKSQAPGQLVESIPRLLSFLKERGISSEEIQRKVLSESMIKRAQREPAFEKQLIEWEKEANEEARFSVVGEAVRSTIALLLSESPQR